MYTEQQKEMCLLLVIANAYFDIVQHGAVDLYSIGVLYGNKISFVQLV